MDLVAGREATGRDATGAGTGATAARLAARGVAVGYGGRMVIDDLDVAIPPGVITTIIGPNGCGKSTLLRTLSRLLRPAKARSCWTVTTSSS